MYLTLYGLKEKPFNTTPDPKFLYLTAGHREALAQLLYGIQQQNGFIVLTGEPGTGKTTLIQSLVQRLEEDTEVAFIFNSMLPFDGILEYILEDLGVAKAGESQAERLVALNNFLIERRRTGQNTVLILDEAQNLEPRTLEQIRLLSNFESPTEKLLQILLVGQPELQTRLELPELRQLKQRIGLRCRIPPLTPEETRDYIWTRLRVAGARDLAIFTHQAIGRIADYAGGIPQVVNVVCDHCLLIGYANQKGWIERDTVEEAIDYLEGVTRPERPSDGMLQPQRRTPGPWFTRKRRAVGLDVGSDLVKAIVLESRDNRLMVTGVGVAAVETGVGRRHVGEAIQEVLDKVRADGQPVVAGFGGPEVVIRQVSLPPLPSTRILPALEMQHGIFGLLPPAEAVLDAQILRRSKDGSSIDVLAVAAPKALIEERARLIERAEVNLKRLDVEALALLNGALHLTGLEPGELLVAVTVGWQRTVLCLFSEQGPVVVRYVEIGADNFIARLPVDLGVSPHSIEHSAGTSPAPDLLQVEELCRDIIGGMAEEIRLSLAFYRSEYDRDSVPRYVLGGWMGLPQLGGWLADRLGLGSPFEVMDPLQALEQEPLEAPLEAIPPGPEFLQAFGLALRGL
ncbi:MAG: AAA family ATPase [Anaerolineae bacterium]